MIFYRSYKFFMISGMDLGRVRPVAQRNTCARFHVGFLSSCQNALRVELLSLEAETQTWRAWRLRFLSVFKDFHDFLEFRRFERIYIAFCRCSWICINFLWLFIDFQRDHGNLWFLSVFKDFQRFRVTGAQDGGGRPAAAIEPCARFQAGVLFSDDFHRVL